MDSETKRVVAGFLIAMLFSPPIAAQTPLGELLAETDCENKPGALPSRYIVTKASVENDFFSNNIRNRFDGVAQNGDHWYTNGFRLERLYHPLCKQPSGFQYALVKRLPAPKGTRQTFRGWAFGMNMYTPDDVKTTAPAPDDRPYSGWLYLSSIALSEDIVDRSFQHGHQHLELQAGLLGAWAKQDKVQKSFHALIGDDEPQGWHHQQEGRLGLNAILTGRRTLGIKDVYYRYQLGLGNVKTFVGAGVEASYVLSTNADIVAKQFGAMQEKFVLRPSDMIVSPSAALMLAGFPAEQPEGAATELAAPDVAEKELVERWKRLAAERVRWKRLSEIKLFFDANAQWVGYNYFLDKGKSPVDHTYEMERIVYDLRAGVSWKKSGWYPMLSYSLNYRTKEFTRPYDAPMDYLFGRVQFDWLWE